MAAFPAGFPRADAIEILKHFENNNTDGTGAAWVQGEGKNREIVVQKYPKALSRVLRKHRSFLGHMPHSGWTIVHLRAASHGDVAMVNTHPFVANNWVVCHNGNFSEFKAVKLALSDRIEFDGDTDSEAAAHLISIAGPKKFSETIDFSGVFFALNAKGDLWALKTSGDLEIQPLEGEQIVMASRFSYSKYPHSTEAAVGWYHLDREGRYIKHKKLRENGITYHRSTQSRGLGQFQNLTFGTGHNTVNHSAPTGGYDPDRENKCWPYSSRDGD